MAPRLPTVRERLLLNLWHHREAEGPVYPAALSQGGMARSLDAARGHIALELGKLEKQGLAQTRLALVSGSQRRVRVYTLSGRGRDEARKLVTSWLAEKVEVDTPEGWRTLTLGEINGRLGLHLTPLELVQSMDELGRFKLPQVAKPLPALPSPPNQPLLEGQAAFRPPSPWTVPAAPVYYVSPRERLVTATLVTVLGLALLVMAFTPFLVAGEGNSELPEDALFALFLVGLLVGGPVTLAGLALAPKRLPEGRELALGAAVALLLALTLMVALLLSEGDYDLGRAGLVILIGLSPLTLARFGEVLPAQARSQGGLAAGVLMVGYGVVSQAAVPDLPTGEGLVWALCGLLTLGVVKDYFDPPWPQVEAGLALGAALAVVVSGLELAVLNNPPLTGWLLVAGWLAGATGLAWLVVGPGLPPGWLKGWGCWGLGILLGAFGLMLAAAGRPGEGAVELLLALPLFYYGWPGELMVLKSRPQNAEPKSVPTPGPTGLEPGSGLESAAIEPAEDGRRLRPRPHRAEHEPTEVKDRVRPFPQMLAETAPLLLLLGLLTIEGLTLIWLYLQL